ncbi:lysozyme inhibitor LprI family protein [Abyssibius alkaniclasticus]|uniref:lysozyme inhibitor LprI family protein n=1 Tax=Abyssibius alkaniclasticus TaxID=2881234 RepID=UPI004059E93D
MRFIALVAFGLTLATSAQADRAEDAQALMDCAAGDDPQACIGTIANACLETATNPEAELACYERETAAWRYPAEGIFVAQAERLSAIADDLPDFLEKSQEGWEDYAYNHCAMIGFSEPDIARQPVVEANCALQMNADRIIELMYLGQ